MLIIIINEHCSLKGGDNLNQKTKKNYRHELKYQINYRDYLILRKRLSLFMKKDNYVNENGEYHIRNLYFDDYNNNAYRDKLNGVQNRSKYRIRIYNMQDNIIKLEKKIKRDKFILKEVVGISRNEYQNIRNGNVEFMKDKDEPLFKEVYFKIKNMSLKPVVIVDYLREPFVYSAGNVRITFDKNLRTGLNCLDVFSKNIPFVSAIENTWMILEVKYDNYLPSVIKNSIQVGSRIHQSFSKYVLCRKYTI